MHVPDGFLDVPTSLATATVAAGAVTVALRRAPREVDERAAPLAGLTAAYVFAAQMLNFPVGVGTSGHLLGGALAAALVGPHTATLVITVVLVVQALLFGDGGLTALGTNVLLMGVVGVWVGWGVLRVVLVVLPKRSVSVVTAAAAGALLSVPAAALAFTVLYAWGGTASVPIGVLAATMAGWHALIGVGEAVITGLTLSAVLAVRPDLVHVAQGLRPALQIRTTTGIVHVPPPAPRDPRRFAGLVAAGLAVALLLAGVASFLASDHPDGLEYVAGEAGFLGRAQAHLLGEQPLADYGSVGGIPVGLAGVLGVLVTVGFGYFLFRRVLRRSAARTRDRSPQRV
jgi:cobalt/nickel transport system permease protein